MQKIRRCYIYPIRVSDAAGWTDVRLLKRGCASKAQMCSKFSKVQLIPQTSNRWLTEGSVVRGKNKNYQKMGIKYFW